MATSMEKSETAHVEDTGSAHARSNSPIEEKSDPGTLEAGQPFEPQNKVIQIASEKHKVSESADETTPRSLSVSS